MQGCLNKGTEEALTDYVLNLEDGIHYIYEERLTVLPPVFASKQTSHYLAAIELLAKYRHAAYKLQFVVDWLNGLKKELAKGKERGVLYYQILPVHLQRISETESIDYS